MGLDIKALKPIKFIGKEEPGNGELIEEGENRFWIYTLPFPKIKHLTKFKEGCWECEEFGDGHFSVPYGCFMRLREAICKAIYGKKFDDTAEEIENGTIPSDAPFAEMIDFADNEGSFDYVVARKLCKDFEEHFEKIRPLLSDSDHRNMTDYIHILSDVVKCKGVAFYH